MPRAIVLGLELRGTPKLGRILALPVGCLVAAALVGGLDVTVLAPSRWLGVATVSVGAFSVYQFARAWWLLGVQRRLADDWLRSATSGVVPPLYVWRARQLCSPRQRRMLGKTLRLIEQVADERFLGVRRPHRLAAVQEHREAVETLAQVLESLEQPVTPAGMLRVVDLVTDGASPLWGSRKDAILGEAISTTLTILTPHATNPTRGIRAA